ncbi:MAG: glycoside hydrolase family 15 protein [Anaerolineaceae bacterium]|nr:glycoside hydrolase family 15 protein [Anaerolineaceae bacterium]
MKFDLYQRSIQIILKNQDASGAFIASPNFPTYHFCWLRDSSFIAHSMDTAGEFKSAEAFFRWAGAVIQKFAHKVDNIERHIQAGSPIGKDDFLHTRYTLGGEEVTVDSTWGNFQMDGYGAWLWALAEHIHLSGDTALVKELSSSIETSLRYLKLVWQMPNYDCWEEHPEYLHPYSLATVYAGFDAVARLQSEGTASSITFPAADYASQVKTFIQQYAVVNGLFVKHIYPERSPEPPMPVAKSSVDSSLLGLAVPFNVFSTSDPIFQATLKAIEKDLHRPGGGVYRYRADVYYGGGEWLLLTAWLGWCYARSGKLEQAKDLLTWIETQADAEGNLPEQVNDHTLAPKYYQPWIEKWGEVASPLLWSHAMYIILHNQVKKGRNYINDIG